MHGASRARYVFVFSRKWTIQRWVPGCHCSVGYLGCEFQLQLKFLGSVLECVQMGAAFGNIYVWFVTGFGDFDNLNMIHRWAVAIFLPRGALLVIGWTWWNWLRWWFLNATNSHLTQRLWHSISQYSWPKRKFESPLTIHPLIESLSGILLDAYISVSWTCYEPPDELREGPIVSAQAA
jgi:hypothetical protein